MLGKQRLAWRGYCLHCGVKEFDSYFTIPCTPEKLDGDFTNGNEVGNAKSVNKKGGGVGA